MNAMLAPSRAARSAIARPIPRLAPEISIVLPSRVPVVSVIAASIVLVGRCAPALHSSVAWLAALVRDPTPIFRGRRAAHRFDQVLEVRLDDAPVAAARQREPVLHEPVAHDDVDLGDGVNGDARELVLHG